VTAGLASEVTEELLASRDSKAFCAFEFSIPLNAVYRLFYA
jgi:hypothetical protein